MPKTGRAGQRVSLTCYYETHLVQTWHTLLSGSHVAQRRSEACEAAERTWHVCGTTWHMILRPLVLTWHMAPAPSGPSDPPPEAGSRSRRRQPWAVLERGKLRVELEARDVHTRRQLHDLTGAGELGVGIVEIEGEQNPVLIRSDTLEEPARRQRLSKVVRAAAARQPGREQLSLAGTPLRDDLVHRRRRGRRLEERDRDEYGCRWQCPLDPTHDNDSPRDAPIPVLVVRRGDPAVKQFRKAPPRRASTCGLTNRVRAIPADAGVRRRASCRCRGRDRPTSRPGGGRTAWRSHLRTGARSRPSNHACSRRRQERGCHRIDVDGSSVRVWADGGAKCRARESRSFPHVEAAPSGRGLTPTHPRRRHVGDTRKEPSRNDRHT
jgi:hypothetical protein